MPVMSSITKKVKIMSEVFYQWLSWLAWLLALIAIGFWLWFGIGSAYVEQLGPMNWVLHIVVPGGIFLLSALIAWRWEGVGGTLFVLEGLIALGFVAFAFLWRGSSLLTTLMLGLTLVLLPLAAGILFLLDWRHSAAA